VVFVCMLIWFTRREVKATFLGSTEYVLNKCLKKYCFRFVYITQNDKCGSGLRLFYTVRGDLLHGSCDYAD